MVLCENCKAEIKKKKEKKEMTEEEDGGGAMALLLLAGAGIGGYFLLKKLQPTETVAKTTSPLESDQNLPTIEPTTEKEKGNMIRVD